MILTDAKIKGTKAHKETFRLKDGEGLHLIIRPNGSKHWQLRYRFLNKEKTLSLGKYPRVSLAEARSRKVDAMRLLDSDIEPSARRREEKAQAIFRDRNSFGSVSEDWFERNKDSWTPRHAKNTRSRLDLHIQPKLKNRPVEEIRPLELLDVLQSVERSGAVYMAHRCLQICNSIFNFAIITGRAQHNIAIGLNSALKHHKEKHHPTLRATEIPGFLDALEALESCEQNKLAFKLLLLTALRTGEMRFSKWCDIDIRAKEWRIPAENTKMRTEHMVPLPRQGLSLLDQLRELTGHQKWLFPTICGYRHEVMSENTINDMIKRMDYKGRIVGHGFRSLFSTVLNENGFNRDAIERQLAHMERNAIRAAYNRAEYMKERQILMQWWANFLFKH